MKNFEEPDVTSGEPRSIYLLGTGPFSASASLSSGNTWARAGANWANGNNSCTATATEGHGRSSQDTINCNLLSTNYFSYDPNGNLRTNGDQVLAYDNENQLISITVSNAWRSEFVYDGKMRRRIRREYLWQSGTWNLQAETRYVYDGMLVIQERDTNNLPAVTYTRGNDLSGTLEGAGGIGGLLARTDNRLLIAGDVTAHAYYHSDGNGNITCLINANQQVLARYLYDPFGDTISHSGQLADGNLYRFSSKEYHASSRLYYYGYRFYSPALQRWVNQDPLGELGSLPVITAGKTPWSESDGLVEMGDGAFFDAWVDINRNLHGAMGNNPLNQRDSWGLCGEEEAAAAAEKAADAVRETLQKANEFAKKSSQLAREAWGKNNGAAAEEFEKEANSATEQARKLMEEYQVKKGRAAELREAANAAKASRFWPRAGRFLRGVGATLVTIPARIPLMLIPIWEDPNYCRDHGA